VAGNVIKLIPTVKRGHCVNCHQRVDSRCRGSEDEKKLAARDDSLPVGAGRRRPKRSHTPPGRPAKPRHPKWCP
jgi:hypothetical protein